MGAAGYLRTSPPHPCAAESEHHFLGVSMLVYLDTNVYSHICESRATAKVSETIHRLGWEVVASADNLFEMFAIADVAKREREVATLTALGRRLDRPPHSYRQAMEVLQAIRRYRPKWVRSLVFDRLSREFRAKHDRRWADAKKGIFPSPAGYAAYRRDFEKGTAGALEFQRELRQRKLKQEIAVIAKQFGNKVGAFRTDLERPDAFWRAECWLAFDSALLHRDPASRDLHDWLAPHLKMMSVTAEELFLLWMRDIEPADVPIASWSGLVAWGQLHAKASHGNANDQQHAAMAVTTDLFITADVKFHRALQLAAPYHGGRLATFALWPRALSVSDAMANVIAQAGPQRTA